MNNGLVRVLIPFGILALAGALAFGLFSSRKPPEQAVVESKAYLVDAMEVSKQDLNFIVNSQGTVLPKIETVLSAQVTGMVVDVATVFIEGGMFRKGDTLVTLEQSDYITDVKAADAELARAQAALQEEQARGKVAAEEWRSIKGGIAPELGLRKPQLATEISNVKAAEARVERAKRNLQRTTIKAPYDGLVRERSVDLGQFVTVGSRIGMIYSTDVAEVRMPLSDSDLAYLQLPNSGSSSNRVTLSATVAGQKTFWQGILSRNEGILDEQRRVIYAVAQVQDPYQRTTQISAPQLKFGRFVTAEIVGDRGQDIVLLPRNVMRLDGTVLVVSDDKTLDIRSVDLQRADEQFVYIRSGLQNGELVVNSTVPNPYQGMPVRLQGDEPTPPAEDKNTDDSTAIVTVNEGVE
jgi:RND family efflux transporter MFP subunit